MSNPLTGTYETAKRAMESAHHGAADAANGTREAIGAVQAGGEHVVARARATWWDGFKVIAGAVTMLRSIQATDALGWIGLARRKSPLLSLGIFGAGVAVGAGAGLLFAPMSGVEMRRRIVDGFAGGPRGKTAPEAAISAAEALAAETKNKAVEAAHHAIDRAAAKASPPGNDVAHLHETSNASPAIDGDLHVA